MKKIVFLHIPKTAGQTVHSELSRIVGADQTSPVRVHTQAPNDGQFPAGYRLYSGHLDWNTLDDIGNDRFVFTILRDPFERIASFYFYLHHKSLGLPDSALTLPENTGLRKIRHCSIDDYFFGGTKDWQRFILDHYANFYCAYFATRKIRGAAALADCSSSEILTKARMGASQLNRIYSIENLGTLESDLHQLTGKKAALSNTRINAGPGSTNTKRWPLLLDRIESDANRQKLADFAALDVELMGTLVQNGLMQ